jgi:uncharacterized protein YaaR (DUF327 family)
MSALEVVFQLPRWIELGLKSGIFHRVGGVIVESQSKQVVAWLRDSGTTDMLGDVAGSVLGGPLSFILNIAQMGVTLYDGHKTREAIDVLSGQVQSLIALTATGQILSLALTAATFKVTLQKLDKISDEIARLGEIVQAEFNRDRLMEFKTALQAARDVFESSSVDQRSKAARSAIDGLYKARENFFEDYQKINLQAASPEQLLLAQHYLVQAMYAEISRIRCYLTIDELELAKNRFAEDLPRFTQSVQHLIKAWLGKYPAQYFHKTVTSDDLRRFLFIQRWLKGDDMTTSDDDAEVLFKIIDDLRQDFWNSNANPEEQGEIVKQFVSLFQSKKTDNKMSRLTQGIIQSEALIENFDRLAGFDLELRHMRLRGMSFEEWENLIPEEDIKRHGFGMVIEPDAAAKYYHLS